MHRERRMVWRWVLISLTLWAGQAIANPGDEEDSPIALSERAAVRVNALTSDFRFDGRPNDAAWSAATDSIAQLTMVEPDEGGVPDAPTTVKVFANSSEIIVAAHCRDLEPDRIVSFSKAQDSDLSAEDHLLIVFDTFLDSRSGYVFAVNPSGVRFDGLVPKSGDDLNVQWNTIWEAKTSRDETGWYVEIRIPIKSLSFKRDLTQWGFNVQRRVERSLEVSRWSGIDLDYDISQTSRAGLLTDLPAFDFGVGLSVRPSFVTRARKTKPGAEADFESDLSLDVTQKLTSNMVGSLTINTDFAETEVDVQQINLTRFPAFFPEKRSFFLEGSDIFEFGAGLDEESLLPFFSRRIGLIGPDEEEQAEVPINIGGKIDGRMGGANFGALVVNTSEEDSLDVGAGPKVRVPGTTMGALRVSQNVLEESSMGMIATVGDQQNRADSWMAGVDFTYETSSFRGGEKNFLAGIWGIRNDRAGLTGDKSAWGFRIDYPNDLWDINLTSIRLGNGFDPSLGFMPRNNVQIWDFNAEYKPRPQFGWMRQMFHEFSFSVFNKPNNSDWESYGFTIKPIDWLLESGDRFDVSVSPEGDRPTKPFEIVADVDLPKGTYRWVRYSVGVRSSDKRRLSSELRFETGNNYNGDLDAIIGRLTWKPSALLAVEFTGEQETGEVWALPDDYEELGLTTPVLKSFDERLFGFRTELNVSSDLQFSSFTQYDRASREWGSNCRLRWTFDPYGDLFVVYNVNWFDAHKRGSWKFNDRWKFASSELPVKVQYAVQF